MKRVVKLIKDILFPIFCADCGKEGVWWCAACQRKFKSGLIAKCPICNRHCQDGSVCPVCRELSPLDGAVAFLNYTEGRPAAALIQKFKYRYAREIADVWRKILAPIKFSWLKDGEDIAIMPVPLHTRRERERGFNQAEILADIFREKMAVKFPNINFRVESGLIRHRFTKQQARLSKQERIKNIKDAFIWRGKKCPKKIILIDDVFTSGATLQECARTLKSAGAETVWGVLLARAV